MKTRPVIFVGSSREGLEYAKALQANLDHACQVVLWSQGVFGLSNGTLEDLVEKLATVDFAVLVVTPDDLITSRGSTTPAPRDNVLLELGICIGELGRERSFLVYNRSSNIKLPSDIAGITHANFQPHDDGNAQAALGAACTQIEQKVSTLGERIKHDNISILDKNSEYRIIADLLGEISANYIIQMYETGRSVPREEDMYLSIGNYWYGIEFPGRKSGNGRFSINELCQKVKDAGILAQDLKFNITLTKKGELFAKWLIKNGYKANAFISPLGEWGELSEFSLTGVEYLKNALFSRSHRHERIE